MSTTVDVHYTSNHAQTQFKNILKVDSNVCEKTHIKTSSSISSSDNRKQHGLKPIAQKVRNQAESSKTLDNVSIRNNYFERNRKKKEAYNHQHFSSAGSKHSKEVYEPSEPYAPVDKVPVKVKEKLSTLFWANVLGYEDGPYYDGSSYLALSDNMVISDQTKPVKCKSFGVGFYVVGDKSNENISPFNPCVSTLQIEGYRKRDGNDNDMFQIPVTYVILTPLWNVYCKNMPTSVITDKVINALSSLALRQNIPVEYSKLVDSTILAYVAFLHRRDTLVLQSTDMLTKTANNAEILGVSERHRLDTLCLFDVQEVHMPIVVDNVECELFPYEVRNDFTVLIGEEFMVGGKPNFQPGMEYRRRYQTVFGSFRGRLQDFFVQYASSSGNMNAAAKRLIGCKGTNENEDLLRLQSIASAYAVKLENDKRNYTEWNSSKLEQDNKMFNTLLNNRYPYEETIITDQHKYMAKQVVKLVDLCNVNTLQGYADGLKNATNWAYYTIYEQFLHLTNYANSRSAAADIRNCKKKLRQHIVNGTLLHTADDIMVRKLEAKIKREQAKFNKPPRLFVTYGDGAMYANELPEFIKVCLDGLHIMEYKGFTCHIYIMAKPKDDTMEKLFNELHESRAMNNHMTVVLYSDDFCIAGMKDGEAFGGNGDISSNDSSQDMAAFYPLYLMLANFDVDRAEGLMKQCMLPIEMINPENKKEKIVIRFDGPFQGSGTTLTTALNHIGNFNNCVGIFYYFATHNCTIEEAVSEGAKAGGHVVTFESWGSNFEKCQFLKRSPARVDGRYVPTINLGCILRSLGSIDDDLECRHLGVSKSVFATMSFATRMDLFVSSVIRGWKHEPGNRILEALRQRFCSGHESEVDKLHLADSLVHTVEIKDYSDIWADNLNERYDLDDDEISEAVQLIKNFQLGWHVSCRAFAKIYNVDYGLVI